MSDRVFVDTNVLVYCYTADESEKKNKALAAVNEYQSILISSQVLSELSNVLRKKFSLSWKEIADVMSEANKNFTVHTNTYTTVRYACAIADKYQLSFYDALICASALESGCSILLSEDMHNGLVIEKILTVKNPMR